ncbi:MAG: potassium channel family protein [Pseudomonadota bacterium]
MSEHGIAWPKEPAEGWGSWSREKIAWSLAVLACLLLLEIVAAGATAYAPVFQFADTASFRVRDLWVAELLVLFSLLFFGTVIVGVIFRSSQHFTPDPKRLARDAAISIVYCILSFAVLYRFLGISLGAECAASSALDHLYFSMVTFSTLGYGDFKPCETARLVAAAQAIYGNLHLGLIVGAALSFAQFQTLTTENDVRTYRVMMDNRDVTVKVWSNALDAEPTGDASLGDDANADCKDANSEDDR